MKNKLKVSLGILSLATCLAVNGYILRRKDAQLDKANQNIIELEQQLDNLEENIILLTQDYEKMLLESLIDYFDKQGYYFDVDSGVFKIRCDNFNKNGEAIGIELTNDIYDKINRLLVVNPNVKELALINISGTIDFSKLDLSNIETIVLRNVGNGVSFSGADLRNLNSLTLYNLTDDFNYEPFLNKEYKYINFSEEEQLVKAKKLLENNNLENATIYISLDDKTDKQNVFDCLVSCETKFNEISIFDDSVNTEETLNMISKLNASSVYLTILSPVLGWEKSNLEHEAKRNLDINVNLNPAINSFSIKLFSYDHYGGFEISGINIESENKEVEVAIESEYMAWLKAGAKVNVPNLDKFTETLLIEDSLIKDVQQGYQLKK